MENKDGLKKGLTTGMLSAAAFGTYGTFAVLLADFGMTGDSLTVILPFILTIYFGLVVWLKNKAAFKISLKMMVILMALGFIGFDGQNYCLIQAYSQLPFGLVSSIAFTNSFLVMLGSRLMFGNKITKAKVGAGLVCTLGVILVLDLVTVIQSGAFSFEPSSLLWVLGALVTIAGSYLTMKYVMENGVDGMAVFFYMNLFAVLVWWAAIFSPMQMMNEIVSAVSAGGLWYLLCFIVITCIISFHLWAKAIEMVDPTWVAIAYSIDPVMATALGFIVFGQTMNILQGLGIVIILGAVCFTSYLEGNEAPPTIDDSAKTS